MEPKTQFLLHLWSRKRNFFCIYGAENAKAEIWRRRRRQKGELSRLRVPGWPREPRGTPGLAVDFFAYFAGFAGKGIMTSQQYHSHLKRPEKDEESLQTKILYHFLCIYGQTRYL